jgi:predicted lysophospholipase L1 biosynthesis ABC-type transport system permease subunit
LGITIGDQILFSIAGLEKQLIVGNLRKAERNGANPFFYFSLFPADFTKYPKNYFISYNSISKPDDIQFQYSQ